MQNECERTLFAVSNPKGGKLVFRSSLNLFARVREKQAPRKIITKIKKPLHWFRIFIS